MLGFKIKYSHNFSKLLLTKSIVEAILKKMAAISKLEMTSITNLGVSKQKALLGNVKKLLPHTNILQIFMQLLPFGSHLEKVGSHLENGKI